VLYHNRQTHLREPGKPGGRKPAGIVLPDFLSLAVAYTAGAWQAGLREIRLLLSALTF